MPHRSQQERDAKRAEEIAAIGPEDSQRLHRGKNIEDSNTSKKSANPPENITGNAEGLPAGSKRHASEGSGPSEPSTKHQGKRATDLAEGESNEKDEISAPTRRNDEKTKEQPMLMKKGSSDKAKPVT